MDDGPPPLDEPPLASGMDHGGEGGPVNLEGLFGMAESSSDGEGVRDPPATRSHARVRAYGLVG